MPAPGPAIADRQAKHQASPPLLLLIRAAAVFLIGCRRSGAVQGRIMLNINSMDFLR
jgi:hypothetical protein